MPPQAGPTLFPAPGSGYPGNAYVPSTTAQVALNTYLPYPYGPLPYGQVSPLVPYPQYATAPLTPYGMMQPAQTRIEITNNKNPVTVTVPQQPDWVAFPAVQLDPKGAPFGSTPNTAAAFNKYSTSLKPGVTFIPSVNYTFTRNFPIMPNIPPPVDLFTGTGPSGEAPYHIVGSVLSERPRDEDFSKQSKVEITGGPDEAMKQLRLQQLFGNGMSRVMDKIARTRSTRKRFPRAVHQQLYEYHVPGGYLGGDGGIGSDYAAVSAPSEYFAMDEQGDAAFGEHGFGAADRSPIYQVFVSFTRSFPLSLPRSFRRAPSLSLPRLFSSFPLSFPFSFSLTFSLFLPLSSALSYSLPLLLFTSHSLPLCLLFSFATATATARWYTCLAANAHSSPRALPVLCFDSLSFPFFQGEYHDYEGGEWVEM